MPKWYYAKGKDYFGPMGARELKSFVESGRILPTDLVWKEGTSDWVEACRVRGLCPPGPMPAKKLIPPPIPSQSATPPPVPTKPYLSTFPYRALWLWCNERVQRKRWRYAVAGGLLLLIGSMSLLVWRNHTAPGPETMEAAVEAETPHFALESPTDADTESPPRKKDPVTAFGEQLRSELYRAAAHEQARQAAAREETYRRLTDTTCSACRGAGSVNYVDASGNLRQATCQQCFGRGNTTSIFGP